MNYRKGHTACRGFMEVCVCVCVCAHGDAQVSASRAARTPFGQGLRASCLSREEVELWGSTFTGNGSLTSREPLGAQRKVRAKHTVSFSSFMRCGLWDFGKVERKLPKYTFVVFVTIVCICRFTESYIYI